jgi:hypothetical protein
MSPSDSPGRADASDALDIEPGRSLAVSQARQGRSRQRTGRSGIFRREDRSIAPRRARVPYYVDYL